MPATAHLLRAELKFSGDCDRPVAFSQRRYRHAFRYFRPQVISPNRYWSISLVATPTRALFAPSTGPVQKWAIDRGRCGKDTKSKFGHCEHCARDVVPCELSAMSMEDDRPASWEEAYTQSRQ